MKPKISIAIPTYEAFGNGLNFIKKNVDSFKKQTYENLELVISDHSVNDDIKNYINSINESDIKYIKNENDRGLQVENMNNAIINCTGDYIKLMNHDDYMESEDSI
jgi:glycosyltransferase involved in cell wall biosynthesis